MSRINTNINSLIAQRILSQKQSDLSTSLERLSTGLAINRGADNPAGLIASEKLRSEQASLTSAIGNGQRADQVANIAEGGLTEVQSLLTQMQGLVTQTANNAGLSADEKSANQQQIDGILQTIDRIAGTTSFQGTKLLNGQFDFNVTAGADIASVSDYKINAAKIADGNTTGVAVNAIVTQSAQHAAVYLSTTATLDVAAGPDATARFNIEVAGAKGTHTFSFASGTTAAAMTATINQFSDATGVVASGVTGNPGLLLRSSDFGSNQFVSVKVNANGFSGSGVYEMKAADETAADTGAGPTTFANAAGTTIRDAGQDVGAIINGATARGNGLTASVNSDALDVSLTLTATAAHTMASLDALTITGGGAKFSLGPSVDVGSQVRLGLGNVSSTSLGSSSLGFLTSLGSGGANNLINGNLTNGQQIVNQAIDQVSTLRGRLGAFQKFTVGSTINALQVAYENTSAAESAIRDTDFAGETASMTRSQILVQAATNVLQLSNAQPQTVLKLLG